MILLKYPIAHPRSSNEHKWGLHRTTWPWIILLAREEPGLSWDRNVAEMSIRDGFEVQQSGITLTEKAVEEWQQEENSSWWDWLHGFQIGGWGEMHSWLSL